MSETMLHVDANAVAGLLAELFVGEITSAGRICQSCRARTTVGAHRESVELLRADVGGRLVLLGSGVPGGLLAALAFGHR